MSSHPYPARWQRLRAEADASGVDAVLATPGSDLFYLTGYDAVALERLTLLVVDRLGEPTLIVPELEEPTARATNPDLSLRVWRETDDPIDLAREVIGPARTLAVAEQMWAGVLLKLQAALPSARFVSSAPLLRPLRMIKDPFEIELLRHSARIADSVFETISGERFQGRREKEVADMLATLLRQGGCQRVDFTIVGSGPNSASPHHEAGEREIARGDLAVLDFGGSYHGYGSDITRTVAVGESDGEQREVYEVVMRAQRAAVRRVAPGVALEAIDAEARGIITAAGYGERFIHRTGHGIGLDVHEEPYVVAGNREPAAPGMIFSIEPGIYLPERFGVRIEDIVVVTENGVECLNQAPHDLRIVD